MFPGYAGANETGFKGKNGDIEVSRLEEGT